MHRIPLELEDADSVLHCTNCNSDVRERHLMQRSWSGDRSPSCPYCGVVLDSDPVAPTILQEHLAQPAETAQTPLIGGIATCGFCAGTFRTLYVHPGSNQTQPVRFCPHCGTPYRPDQ